MKIAGLLMKKVPSLQWWVEWHTHLLTQIIIKSMQWHTFFLPVEFSIVPS